MSTRFRTRGLGLLTHKGDWNASTNQPSLASGQGSKGDLYIVSVEGSTALDGISDWKAGDWAVFDGTTWEKVDNSEEAPLLGPSYEVHVAKNGSDTGVTGKPLKPFLTVAAAVAYVQSTFTSSENVVIYVHTGFYPEQVTITRPRTHIVGVNNGLANTVQISSITINPSSVDGGVYNSIFSIERVLVSSASGAAITLTGTNECALHLTNVYCFSSSAGVKGINLASTATNGSKVYLTDVTVNNTQSNAIGIDVAKAAVTLRRVVVYSGAASCINVSATGSVIGDKCQLENSGSSVLNLGATSATLASSSLASSAANSDGAVLVAGSTLNLFQSAIQVPAGTGFAVKGVAGSVFTYALNTFIYGYNNKVSAAITSVPHSTTFTTA